MKSVVKRFFALLLVPCLLADPVTAAAFGAPAANAFAVYGNPSLFETQAFSLRVVFGYSKVLFLKLRARVFQLIYAPTPAANAAGGRPSFPAVERLNDNLLGELNVKAIFWDPSDTIFRGAFPDHLVPGIEELLKEYAAS